MTYPSYPSPGQLTEAEMTLHAREVAAALSKETGYEHTAEHPEGWHSRSINGGGYKLHLAQTYPYGKICVRGSYPKHPDRPGQAYYSPNEWGVIGYNDKAPGINYNHTRKPEAIAKDIMRRFLAPYLNILNLCQEAAKAASERRDGRAELARRVATAAGYGDDWNDQSPGWQANSSPMIDLRPLLGDGWGDATISGPDTVTLELHGLSADLAVRIVGAIRQAGA